jgi:hypothetical protein
MRYTDIYRISSSLRVLKEFNLSTKSYMEDFDSTFHFFPALCQYVPGNWRAASVIMISDSGLFVGNGGTQLISFLGHQIEFMWY